MQPSDSLVPIGLDSLVLSSAYPEAGSDSLRDPFGSGHEVRVPANSLRARGLVTGSPCRRSLSEKDEGLPGYWAVLFVRAVVSDPAG